MIIAGYPAGMLRARNARLAVAAAAALLCFVVGMLVGVDAAGGTISDILLMRTQTVQPPAHTVVRTDPPVTVTTTVTDVVHRHGHKPHHQG